MHAHSGSYPRGFTRADAARYCRISPATFSRWVKLGRMPPPIPGTRRWDRDAIDSLLDGVNSRAPSLNDAGRKWMAWTNANDQRIFKGKQS